MTLASLRLLGLVFLLAAGTSAARGQAAATGPEPTREQFREFMELIPRLPENRIADIFAEADEKTETLKWNNRDRLAWLIAEARKAADEKPPATPLPTGDMGSYVHDLRLFSPTAGIALTQLGILATDGSVDKWKGVTPWDPAKGSAATILGGTADAVYILVTNSKTVIVKEGFDPPKGRERDIHLHRQHLDGKDVLTETLYTFSIWRWTPKGGFAELQNLPKSVSDPTLPAACDFFDDKTGGYADGKTLRVTRDGGTTWAESPLPLDDRRDTTSQILFISADQIAFASGTESISLLTLDKAGHATRKWHRSVNGRISYYGNLRWPCAPPMAYDAKNKAICVYTEDGMGGEALFRHDPADGRLIETLQPMNEGETLGSYFVQDGRLLLLLHGPKGAAILRVQDLRTAERKAPTDILVDSYTAHAFVPADTNDLYLVVSQKRLVRWDGRKSIPTMFLPTSLRRATVDTTVLDEAEDKRPNRENPSRLEMKAHDAALMPLTPPQRETLRTELAKKREELPNYRAQILWATRRAQELAPPPAPPSTTPAP